MPYDGRPACNNCGFCGGFGCPIEAKGDPIALLRRGAAHRAGARSDPRATSSRSCSTRSGRRATGVRYLDAERRDARGHGAAYVVLAAGAFETPRLLLRQGLGNSSGLVGRNLMYHFQTFTVGAFPLRLHGDAGALRSPAPHDDHIVGDEAQRRGRPRSRAAVDPRRARRARRRRPADHGGARSTAPGAHHGAGDARLVARDRLWVFTMQGEDLAQPTQPHRPRPDGPRRLGLPGRAGDLLPAPPRAGGVGPRRARSSKRVLRDAGAEWTITLDVTAARARRRRRHPLGIAPASYHIMGTAGWAPIRRRRWSAPRAGSGTSTTCSCADSSVFATSAGYNPTLTIMALAARTARLLLDDPLPADRTAARLTVVVVLVMTLVAHEPHP